MDSLPSVVCQEAILDILAQPLCGTALAKTYNEHRPISSHKPKNRYMVCARVEVSFSYVEPVFTISITLFMSSHT
jgi:hypothetical protein